MAMPAQLVRMAQDIIKRSMIPKWDRDETQNLASLKRLNNTDTYRETVYTVFHDEELVVFRIRLCVSICEQARC
jgi:hypothetical protein